MGRDINGGNREVEGPAPSPWGPKVGAAEDDVGALRSVHRILASDGRLFLTVPAHSALWSNEDVYVGHYRRYGKRSVSSVLHEAGFEVEDDALFEAIIDNCD